MGNVFSFSCLPVVWNAWSILHDQLIFTSQIDLNRTACCDGLGLQENKKAEKRRKVQRLTCIQQSHCGNQCPARQHGLKYSPKNVSLCLAWLDSDDCCQVNNEGTKLRHLNLDKKCFVAQRYIPVAKFNGVPPEAQRLLRFIEFFPW